MTVNNHCFRVNNHFSGNKLFSVLTKTLNLRGPNSREVTVLSKREIKHGNVINLEIKHGNVINLEIKHGNVMKFTVLTKQSNIPLF